MPVETGDVLIRVEPVRAFVDAPPEIVEAVREFLTVESPEARFTPQFKAKKWDGKTGLMRRGTNAFPAGLASRVCSFLIEQFGVRPVVQRIGVSDLDERLVNPEYVRRCLAGVELRDYQVNAVRQAIDMRRAAIQLPTGTGKTEVGAALVKLMRRPTLWIVHGKTTLSQTVDRLRVLLDPRTPDVVGSVGAGSARPGFVTIGIVNSLNNLGNDFFDEFGVLIVDEVHHAPAASWHRVAGLCSKAGWRFGLSGTVLAKKDEARNLRMEGTVGPILLIPGTETMELADRGFLARPVITMIDVGRKHYPSYETVRATVLPDWKKDPRRLGRMGGELFRTAYEMGIVYNEARNDRIVREAAAHADRGEKVLVLCSRLSHGQRLTTKLADATPVPLAWLHGKEKDKVRLRALEDFRNHRSGAVLVASTIFDEGVDIPEVDVLVLAGAGESHRQTIQRVGRSLRPRPDKSEVRIYDFLDGWDSKSKKDYLAQHSLARLKDYREQGFEVRQVKEGHR